MVSASAKGPRWFEGLLWFSDMLGEAVHTVNLHGDMTTLPLAGHAPSGLGFRPDGSLLIASTENRAGTALRRRHRQQRSPTCPTSCPRASATWSSTTAGRAYVGSQACEGGVIVRVDPDGTSAVVAQDLDFPNGMVITPDGKTLIVAESIGRRLTAFTIGADGSLSDRRIFADGLDGPPDGIALDAEGGVWTSMTLAHQFDRIVEGGTVTDRIDIGDRTAIACTLGGPERRTLFLLSSTSAYPQRLVGTKLSRLDAMTVDIPGAGSAMTCRLVLRTGRRQRAELGEKFVATDLVRSTWSAAIQHGAPVSALLVRALERCEQRDDTRLSRVMVDLLGGVPAEGDLWVRSRIERSGKQIELVSAEMLAPGPDGEPRPVARASGWRLQTVDTAEVVHAPAPPLRPLSETHSRGLTEGGTATTSTALTGDG